MDTTQYSIDAPIQACFHILEPRLLFTSQFFLSQVIWNPAVGGDVPGLHALPWPSKSGGHAASYQRRKVSSVTGVIEHQFECS